MSDSTGVDGAGAPGGAELPGAELPSAELPSAELPSAELPRAEFGFPGSLRDRLVGAILDGSKTSTTSTLVEYSVENEPLPVVGSRQVVVDSAQMPVAIIETEAVEVVRLAEVGLEHAVCEGEDYTSVNDWRTSHEAYWQGPEMRAYLGDPTFAVTDDTRVVLERFHLVQVLG